MLPSATQALALFAGAELSPRELLKQVLATVEARDAELGAYVEVMRDAATAEAAAAEQAWHAGHPGPLAGLPLSVKDLFDVAGTRTGCGNPVLQRPLAAEDAAAVQRLRAAGAVLVGKVHLHEFALGITGENARLGTPRNPWDTRRLPGGSSSGSAVSVAGGMAIASLGTDTGGSVRVPAALCGLVGFKPSFGRISRQGVYPLAWSMDHVGVIARTVDDAALICGVLQGADPRARETQGLPAWGSAALARGRVGLLSELHAAASRSVRQVIEAALQKLVDAGLVVEALAAPRLERAREAYSTLLLAEAATVHRRVLALRPAALGEDLRRLLAAGARTSASEYILALREREALSEEYEALLARYDALVTPTTLVTAPLRGQQEIEIEERRLSVREALITCTCPFSMMGLPAISVPCGFAEGLPVGLQLVGSRYGEALVLELARRVERSCSSELAR